MRPAGLENPTPPAVQAPSKRGRRGSLQFWGPLADTRPVEKVQRFRFVAIVGVVMAVLSAGFALAGDAFDDPADEPTPTTCEPIGDDPIEDTPSRTGTPSRTPRTPKAPTTVRPRKARIRPKARTPERGRPRRRGPRGAEDPDEGEDSEDAEECATSRSGRARRRRGGRCRRGDAPSSPAKSVSRSAPRPRVDRRGRPRQAAGSRRAHWPRERDRARALELHAQRQRRTRERSGAPLRQPRAQGAARRGQGGAEGRARGRQG